MTAVDYLYKIIHARIHIDKDLSEYFNEAKEIEKQQIIDAHFTAQKEDLQFWNEAKQEALEYYNETFKSE